jgi:hypothetical protein
VLQKLPDPSGNADGYLESGTINTFGGSVLDQLANNAQHSYNDLDYYDYDENIYTPAMGKNHSQHEEPTIGIEKKTKGNRRLPTRPLSNAYSTGSQSSGQFFSHEDQIDRELLGNEIEIAHVQAEMQGTALRMRTGETMQKLWDSEPQLVELQSRIRGNFARQVVEFQMNMRRFTVSLQSRVRGFLIRKKLPLSNHQLLDLEAKQALYDIAMSENALSSKSSESEVSVWRIVSTQLRILSSTIAPRVFAKSNKLPTGTRRLTWRCVS